ncbi:carbohydrate ABC transporter permease [Priestia endophytica]|uniref:Sn-glycerol 3-phosphate transport system permease protein n=1 Tax=Priestia endophytica DSM 13796 TaxID=1121089 RepID=A0A1I6BYK5_9BACI|nr:carbohydrate ABC transporter permease [Priestia endophytica]KYG33240.1 glycerol-3-phosphate ABC transporter permease [Priestia endophytica]SFQ85983.1 sn-glycerol 3-phosphate transport system permease protein [Priestia endophytica DSM 13796]
MKEIRSKKFIFYTLLIISALVIFFPIFYAISVSFMSEGDVRARKLWPSDFTFSNYGSALEQMPLLHYLKNSFIVSSVVMIGQLILSSLAAYTFAFLQFKGRNVLFFIFISTMLIPWEATMIPNFLMVQGLGWTNSYAGLTIPFFATAFGIFLLRQHFLTVPYELREASLIEGLGHFGFLTRVVVPYCKTSFITLGVYSFLTTWNMYLWPLLVTSDDSARTVQIGMKQLRSQEVATDWRGVMAGATIIVIPTLILLFLGQKQLQQGLTKGAIK